eukprot:403998_1
MSTFTCSKSATQLNENIGTLLVNGECIEPNIGIVWILQIYKIRHILEIYFRPKVIYNKNTKQYILWINYVSYKRNKDVNYKNTSLMVATSLTPNGPFNIINYKVDLKYAYTPGDFVLFIDNSNKNNKGYIAYDAYNNNHKISIEP